MGNGCQSTNTAGEKKNQNTFLKESNESIFPAYKKGTNLGRSFQNEINIESRKKLKEKNTHKKTIKIIQNHRYNNAQEDANNDEGGYIIAKIDINKDNVNKEISIISSYEACFKDHNDNINFKKLLPNEKEIRQCQIKIDSKKIFPFSSTHIFKKERCYEIKYSFKNPLTNINCLFYDCYFSSLCFSNLNTKYIINVKNMFNKCFLLKLNLSNFKSDNLTDMSYMFNGCSSLESLDLSNFNTDNVTDMRDMFKDCSSLKSLDLSNFNTVNVTDMDNMFSGCSSLKSLDLSNFNTENVIHMENMFNGCSSLKSLDLNNFKTENVINMSYMFYNCKSLKSLDLSNFSSKKLNNRNITSKSCFDLTRLNTKKDTANKGVRVSRPHYVTSNEINLRHMFLGCDSLDEKSIRLYDKLIYNEFKRNI